MSVKIALLKSGENIIADIKELISEENIVGYLFQNPCIVGYNNTNQAVFLAESEESRNSLGELRVTLSPWILLTEDTKIPVRPDWIVTIVNPATKLLELYEERNAELKIDSTDESADFGITD